MYGESIGCDHADSKSAQPGATPGLLAILDGNFSSVNRRHGND